MWEVNRPLPGITGCLAVRKETREVPAVPAPHALACGIVVKADQDVSTSESIETFGVRNQPGTMTMAGPDQNSQVRPVRDRDKTLCPR